LSQNSRKEKPWQVGPLLIRQEQEIFPTIGVSRNILKNRKTNCEVVEPILHPEAANFFKPLQAINLSESRLHRSVTNRLDQRAENNEPGFALAFPVADKLNVGQVFRIDLLFWIFARRCCRQGMARKKLADMPTPRPEPRTGCPE
jgi:hypothetical protein